MYVTPPYKHARNINIDIYIYPALKQTRRELSRADQLSVNTSTLHNSVTANVYVRDVGRRDAVVSCRCTGKIVCAILSYTQTDTIQDREREIKREKKSYGKHANP